MLFFNLNELLRSSGNNSDKLVKELYNFYLYKNGKFKRYYLPKIRIDAPCNFLINPYPLFEDIKSSSVSKAQYIILAGKRDYNLYKQYGFTGLDLSFYPDIQLDKLKYNPLLNINKQIIKFKFEE